MNQTGMQAEMAWKASGTGTETLEVEWKRTVSIKRGSAGKSRIPAWASTCHASAVLPCWRQSTGWCPAWALAILNSGNMAMHGDRMPLAFLVELLSAKNSRAACNCIILSQGPNPMPLMSMRG
ncbi:hypothetical protein COCOBI_02-4540 [Coccomyxa sp. Obi]|nr:hypothetical protein COCOBI_02-4540 [Coccomyxa sp. Obi]